MVNRTQQKSQHPNVINTLLAFIHLTGGSLAFVRDECLWKGTTDKVFGTKEEYDRARTNTMKVLRRSLKSKQRGSKASTWPTIPPDYDYREIVTHRELDENEMAQAFPHRFLTDDLYQSQFPSSSSTTCSATMGKIPPTQARKSASTPPRPHRDRGRSHSRGTSTPSRRPPVEEVTLSESIAGLSIGGTREDHIPTIPVDSDDVEIIVIEDGSNNPGGATCVLLQDLFVAKAKDGAKCLVSAAGVIYPLQGNDLNAGSLSTSTHIVKLSDEEGGPLDGCKAVMYRIPTCDVRFKEDTPDIVGLLTNFSDHRQNSTPWLDLLKSIYKRFQTFFTQQDIAAASTASAEGLTLRKVAIVLPKDHVNEYDEFEDEDDVPTLTRYGNGYFNHVNGKEPLGNALKTKVMVKEGSIQIGSTKYGKATGYAVCLVAIEGSEKPLEIGSVGAGEAIDADKVVGENDATAQFARAALSNIDGA